MNSAELIDWINQVEERYPVSDWIINGERVWPLLRMRLGFELFFALEAANDGAGAAAAGGLSQRLRQAARMASGAARGGLARIRDDRKNAHPERVDAVFLSDGVSYILLRDQWYERFCGPLINRLQSAGLSTYMMSPGHAYQTPRALPSDFIQWRLDLCNLASLRARPNEVSLPGFEDCRAYWRAQGYAVDFPSVALVSRLAARQERVRDYFISVLRKTRPAIACALSYYGIEGMAFNLACRALGIPSVDIQHGVQGKIHFAYGRWKNLPADGYGQMPRYFWCWSEVEAEAIREWNGPVAQYHEPLVGGNLWLREWQSDAGDEFSGYDRQVQSLKTRFPGQHVLLTLQFGLAGSETERLLLEIMQRSPKEWRWWIRLHPCMLDERKRIRQLLQEHGIDGSLLDAATDLPLFALLRRMDVHVTHSSSTVIEAADFNVPSVVISDYGEKLFPEHMASGMCKAAFTADDAVAGLQMQLAEGRRVRESGIAKDGRGQAETLDFFLDMAKSARRQATA